MRKWERNRKKIKMGTLHVAKNDDDHVFRCARRSRDESLPFPPTFPQNAKKISEKARNYPLFFSKNFQMHPEIMNRLLPPELLARNSTTKTNFFTHLIKMCRSNRLISVYIRPVLISKTASMKIVF